MFMVTQILLFIFELFADAEAGEDGLEDVVVGDGTGDFGKGGDRATDIFGQKFRRDARP